MDHNHMEHMKHGAQMDEKKETTHRAEQGTMHEGHGAPSENGAHTSHAHVKSGHMSHMGNIKQKFIVSLFLMIPIIVLSPMMGIKLPFQFTFLGSEWVVLVLATILFFYGGMPFLKGAKMELQEKNPAMMTLISLGITVSYVYSLYAFAVNNILHSGGHLMDFFWELATLIVIMLLGHWIEMNAVSNAKNALQKMAELLPGKATVKESDGTLHEEDLKNVRVGQNVVVKAGEKVPVDGKIVDGHTTVNESLVTGEAREVAKAVGEKVIGGSVNGSGVITVEVTGTGETGYLAQVMKLIERAQREKSKTELLSNRVAKWLFYVALFAGVLTFTAWLLWGYPLETALTRMVTVLVIACPHALGLAIPLVVARSTSLGAKNGLLIQDRQALETAKKVDVVMMDKTGTLTEGNFQVSEVRALSSDYSEQGILTIAAALEENSNHLLSAGILRAFEKTGAKREEASGVQNLPGVGLTGTVGEKRFQIASASWLGKEGIAYDNAHFRALAEQGNAVSFLLEDTRPVGLIAQGDRIKPEAKQLIEALKKRGIRPIMLTGDNDEAAQTTATQLGLSEFRSSLMPEDKEKIVREFMDKGFTVMMVGDGVNDAPSLARASVGVAIGAGTDVAIDSADVILVKSDPKDILHVLSLAKNTARKMVENLWWGAGYNIVAIPLAAGVLAPFGVLLSPAVGAVLMSLSTVIVAINALTLRMD